MLEAKLLNSYYGEFHALKDVSIQVQEREFVAILGPNGHGKSTLLKTLCGLLPPVSGQVLLGGVDIAHMPPRKIVEMGLVYIAEDRHLFPEMTVMENLRMGAYCPHARKKAGQNLEYVFELFPKLKTLSSRLASALSGGEARMLAVGRGLMSDARILAVDEPSLGLAPILRTEVFRKLGEINQNGMTILLVEQSIRLAAEYAQRLYLMEDGHIRFEGSREEAVGSEQVRKAYLGR
jgi:branched-chain amino acid transport system ATP-binding protein